MVDKKKVYSGASPEEVSKALQPLVNFCEEGIPIPKLSKMVEERLVPHLMHYDLPGFQSMFNAFPEEGAALGSHMALNFNQGVTNWQVSPGGAVLEELCCQALCKLFGFGPDADATFMYSGTYANQQALYMALHHHAERKGFDLSQKGVSGFDNPTKLKVLLSEDAHFSLHQAVRMLGLGEQSLVSVPVDNNRRMDVPNLLQILDKNPHTFCVVSTAGTTSTGAVDSIQKVVDICHEKDIWLHVDGAYGLMYSLVPGWKNRFKGYQNADSVSWDPHKQMGVPIPNSLLFVRDHKQFQRMHIYSEYFNRQDDMPNPGLKSPPSTRPMAALPLVTSIRHQGLKRLIERLQSPLKVIKELYLFLRDQPDFEVCHEPDTGILCFKLKPNDFTGDLSQMHFEICNAISQKGERSISTTKINGETVLRILAVSPQVTSEALKETIHEIRQTFVSLRRG